MNAKEVFLEEVNNKLTSGELALSETAICYFDSLKAIKTVTEAPDMTEAGKTILGFMQNNADLVNNKFTAKSIGEGIFATGRSVSGSMRKLVASGYVEKFKEGNRFTYSITNMGRAKVIQMKDI